MRPADAATSRDDVVSIYHGSINDAIQIRARGFDPRRGTPYVTTDINAATDAIGPGRYEVSQGLAHDPGIIESRIPRLDFERVLVPLQRSYNGFYPYLPNLSSEILLRTPESIDLFNRYIMK